MGRKCLFDNLSSAQVREAIDMQSKSREHWYKHNREMLWYNNIGPIQGRMMAICEDKQELARKLMDSQDEYFKFCVPPPKPAPNQFVIQIGPDPCDECYQDPTIPMRTPPEEQRALLFEGHSTDLVSRGRMGYLKNRYGGLPETKFCRPPTSNSEYAWKLLETVQRNTSSDCSGPRKTTIGSSYRSRGVLCQADFAPFHFP